MSDPINPDALRPALESLMAKAKSYGAEKADAVATHGRSVHVTVRGGEMEEVDNSEGRDIGLRVMIGQRQACVSSSDISNMSLDKLAERAVAMARLAPEDPYCGLPNKDELVTDVPELELYDDADLSPAELLKRAKRIEDAALDIKGVSQAEGMNANLSSSAVYFMTSDGFSRGWRSSRHGMSGMAFATDGEGMERDYDVHGTRWLSDLKTPEEIGKTAGERVIARLGARQLQSGEMPVIFDKRVSGALIAALLSAINGSSIARGNSFLKDKMDEQLFTANINIMDDPLINRGHGSRPWDGEGIAVKPLKLIENGVLKTWLLNTSVGKQLDLPTTGHGARGIGSPPGIASSNTYMLAGKKTLDTLMKDMGDGLHVTEMFGPSLNPNTGDYSVGVAGFRIEKGQRAHPVSEITIAANILDMYRTLIPANDLEFDASTVAPSLLIERMTIAGE